MIQPDTVLNDNGIVNRRLLTETAMKLRLLTFTFLSMALLAPWAGAVSGYLSAFESAYPAAKQSRIDSCALCHTSAPARNGYGAAFKTANHSFAAIQDADSDGDGYSNQVEINAWSFPGNASDKPVGMVHTVIDPDAARTAGAQWRLAPSGGWQDSNATVIGVPVGTQTVQFKALTGWVAPADKTITVSPNLTTMVTGTYARALVTVPNVVGQTQASATAALAAVGLVLGTIAQDYSATVPAGTVINQTPPAGSSASSGSAVTLLVSKGPQPITVPNVVGQTQAAASTAITGAGLVVGAVTQRHDATVPDGMVISQSPAAGAQAAPGSAVGLLMSQGPGPVTVPDVTGQTQSAATTVLAGAGLGLGNITQEYSASVSAGRVASQSPQASLQAEAGSLVDLVLSLGPQPIDVPNVVGLSQTDATTAITGAGFTVGQITETASDTIPAGSVISQSPAAGTMAVPNSLINLTISSGPPSSGCACLNGQKSVSVFGGVLDSLGDLFLVGLSLLALRTMTGRNI